MQQSSKHLMNWGMYQEIPIRHRGTALYIYCYSFAYSERVLIMLYLVAPTVCLVNHIRPEPLWVLMMTKSCTHLFRIKFPFPRTFQNPVTVWNVPVWGRVCACRLKNIACCTFYKCRSSEECQNPNWCNQQTFVSLYVLEIFCLCTYLNLLVELSLYTRGCINDLAFT